MTFSLHVEWEEAPGVSDVVDKQAWARLVIAGSGDDVFTRCLDQNTGQTRTGVYESLFPLARWIANSYWNLLNEAPRVPKPSPGRELVRHTGIAPWVRRHNLLAAREGYSLPDLSLARDGEYVVVWAFPDEAPPTHRPVRFLHSGVTQVSPAAMEHALQTFMGTVLDRLADVDHHSVAALRDDWAAVLRSNEEERNLCVWAAKLGVDPYDSTELSADDESFFRTTFSKLTAELRDDLLDASDSIANTSPAPSGSSRRGAGGVQRRRTLQRRQIQRA